MKQCKMVARLLLVTLLACALSISTLAYDGSEVTGLCDFEDFETSDDIIFNWYVQPGNEACGKLELDTTGCMHGANSMLFDYSMKGAQSTGKGWCTFNFVPDEMDCSYGSGVKFSAQSDNHLKARIVIVDETYNNFKQYFFEVGKEPRDYVIRWEDFTNIPGQHTFDPATATGIASMDIALIDGDQPADIDWEGKFWFDDFCFFEGDDDTTPAGKPMVKQVEVEQTTTTTTQEPTQNTTETTTTAADVTTTTKAEENTTTTTLAAANTDVTEQDGSNWWIWLIVGVVVLGGVAAFFVVKGKKKA